VDQNFFPVPLHPTHITLNSMNNYLTLKPSSLLKFKYNKYSVLEWGIKNAYCHG